MITSNGIKRNHVVYDKNNKVFPARVWKVLSSDSILVIDCGLHVKILDISNVEKTSYRGRWVMKTATEKSYFLGMSRLRSLLKGARHYNPTLTPEV